MLLSNVQINHLKKDLFHTPPPLPQWNQQSVYIRSATRAQNDSTLVQCHTSWVTRPRLSHCLDSIALCFTVFYSYMLYCTLHLYAAKYWAALCCAVLYKFMQYCTIQLYAILYCTIIWCTILYNFMLYIQYWSGFCFTVLYTFMLYSTVQLYAVQYWAALCCTVLYNFMM